MNLPLSSLVIASHNTGKVHEIEQLVAPLGIAVKSATEMSLPEPEETGDSFAANAQLKSQSALKHSGLPSLADDSGLVVPALSGAPGIYSARWAGPKKDFSLAIQRLQDEGAQTGMPAYFICILALSRPNERDKLFEGRINGTLTFPAKGELGFGYDPIFTADGHHKTFAEIDSGLKQAISHRAVAFKKFVTFLDSLSKV